MLVSGPPVGTPALVNAGTGPPAPSSYRLWDRAEFKFVLNAGGKLRPTWPAITPGTRGTSCLILTESSMPDTLLHRPGSAAPSSWIGDLTRVPYWVYRDETLPNAEQERIFEGSVWNYLCLEDEIANPGDWRTTVVGRMPVVVARDENGSIAALRVMVFASFLPASL